MTSAPAYTVIAAAGTVLARGCDAAEAAHVILTDDGREYEIRPDHDAVRGLMGFAAACYDQNSVAELRAALAGEADAADCEKWGLSPDEWRAAIAEALAAKTTVTGWTLWTRQQVANRPWAPTVVFSLEPDRAAAEAEIFAAVIAARWPRHPEAVPDAEYDVWVADALHDAAA